MSSAGDNNGSVLLAEGELALGRGESEAAYELLDRARHAGVRPEELVRLARALGRAGRFVNRHRDVLAWIEAALAEASSAQQRATLECARVAVCRQVDVERVLELAEDALAAADAVNDESAYAAVLAHAAFAAYRAGDAPLATRYGARAEAREPIDPAARYEASRARMFAACARGDSEVAYDLARGARDLALQTGRRADAANESNNLAEMLLELGRPDEARAEAQVASELAVETGHRQVEVFARVVTAIATAEVGDLDPALELLAQVHAERVNAIFAMDAGAAEAFWLLERGAGGDVARAREVVLQTMEDTADTRVANRVTALYSQLARAYARDGDGDEALTALQVARRSLDKTEPKGELQLALALAEVFPVDDVRRRTALTNGRSRILRDAARRHDPRAYCLNVRLHRRLLELSGGVPADMLS